MTAQSRTRFLCALEAAEAVAGLARQLIRGAVDVAILAEDAEVCTCPWCIISTAAALATDELAFAADEDDETPEEPASRVPEAFLREDSD